MSGYAYSYVILKMLPLHEHDENVYKTNFVRGGFYPAYGDAFHFTVPRLGLSEQVLIIISSYIPHGDCQNFYATKLYNFIERTLIQARRKK